jgi:hypothetical protein
VEGIAPFLFWNLPSLQIEWNCRSLGFAPNDTCASGPRFSAAPTALRSSSELSPSPSGLGSRLAAGPPGLASMAIL